MSLLPNTSSDYLRGIRDSERELSYLRKLNAHLLEIIESKNKEIDRLQEGNFTEEEFQNLCHNKQVNEGYENFVTGCNEYQKKLFGRCQKEDFEAKEILQKIGSLNEQFKLLGQVR